MSWRKVTGKINFKALSSEEREALSCCLSVVVLFFSFQWGIT